MFLAYVDNVRGKVRWWIRWSGHLALREEFNERDGESIAYLGYAFRRACGVQKPLFGKVPGADTFSWYPEERSKFVWKLSKSSAFVAGGVAARTFTIVENVSRFNNTVVRWHDSHHYSHLRWSALGTAIWPFERVDGNLQLKVCNASHGVFATRFFCYPVCLCYDGRV